MVTEIDKQIYGLVEDGDCEGVRVLLIQHPDKVNEQPTYYSWLHYAAENNDTDMIETLLSLGADVNAKAAKTNSTPIVMAVNERALEAVKCLVENGAEINTGGGESGTPLSAACAEGDLEVVEYLVLQGANMNVVFGDPPNTALSYAVMYKHNDIEEYLRERGARLP
ncbi:ankyrin repeat domain-containing protein [Litoribrevibacter euphylliae]|uniref:Ankyrin repeat domain-containing protein n=1 Tax=Litoribrevibacter euphylliae TaxID=1834034 RepID=A0ABV7HE78_9GAMM